MKRQVILLQAVVILFAACNKTMDQTGVEKNPQRMSSGQIDQFIKEQLAQKGSFEWSTASTDMVWSALQERDQVLSIGYKPASMRESDIRLHETDIQSPEWKEARMAVMQIILEEEGRDGKPLTEKDILEYDETVLPVLNVRVKQWSTIQRLRASELVRYAEPMGYEPAVDQAKVTSSSGCGSNTPEPLVFGTDYTNIIPGAKQSWNYAYHNIPQAWQKSTGAGVKVFIIDTGSEFDQENLGGSFNQGYSAGRTIERIVTLPRETFLGIPTGPVETADDGCGHGTAMAGACAAPRGTDGASAGVAYNCNLVTCRASADVLIDASREVRGVSDAYINAGNRADVKIISMSMGRITSSSQIRDAIRYAYGKGKMIFCAAGTSFSWTSGWYGVIFPATMSEVSAVTGVRDNDPYTTCTVCHDGSQTDFTIVMERGSDSQHPLTLAANGDVPSTVGGSSVATATAAGIAALVWSKYPSYTRAQVLNKLTQSSSNYPTLNSRLGWGKIDANKATN